MTENLPAQRRGGGRAPALPHRLPDFPDLGDALLEAIDVAHNPFEETEGGEGTRIRYQRGWPELTTTDREVAREAHDAYRAALRASCVSPESLLLWLAPVAACVRNPPTDDHLRSFVRGLAFALGETPVTVLTEETQREGMRRWQFFPSAAEVMALLEPIRDEWTRRAVGLGMVLYRIGG